MSADAQLLEVRGLRKSFWRDGRSIPVVCDVDFRLSVGETLALVGPSGSGKSTIARIVMRLIEADAGEVLFDGSNFLKRRGADLRHARQRIQMVFQDPLAAFNPRATVERVLGDPLRIHGLAERTERPRAVGALLEQVGISDDLRHRRVHEVSGGQRQRVAIARALATRPDLIVLDEALSALDASVRKDIVRLLLDLQNSHRIAYLFISHDLALVRKIAHSLIVLDAGRIVERGPASEIIDAPRSETARALIAAVPRLPSKAKE